MRLLLRFLFTSSVRILLAPAITSCQFPLGMSEKKQTSSKVLMWLIVLMFALQTIHNTCDWYIVWLGFIYYNEMPDQAMDALQSNGTTSLSLRLVGSMFSLLTTLRLAIADSIMVRTLPPPPETTNSLHCEGLEVLDHMQSQLEGSNCPSSLQHCICR
jgi:hypothetical protein